MLKIAFIVGTRPNFVKVAPLIDGCKKYNISYQLIHTGQHYDDNLYKAFFKELNIPTPDIFLDIHSSKPRDMRKKTSMVTCEYLKKSKPSLVMVVGDSDATCAGAMAAKQASVKLGHVEAGLRSFFMAMPEERNRLYIDSVSDYLFVSEPSGLKNLTDIKAPGKKFFVGNVMIDSLIKNLTKIKSKKPVFESRRYALLTLHRKSNVHSPKNLLKSIQVINHIADNFIKLVFPIHPRTEKNIKDFGVKLSENIIVVPPAGYIDFQSMVYHSKFVVTDSGGLQDETTFYKIPCITLRRNTERPITYQVGTSVLVGTSRKKINQNIGKIMKGIYKKGRRPKYWDGKTTDRIMKIILNKFTNTG